MRDIILILFVVSSVPFVLKRPYYGILMLALFGYLNPHRLVFGFAAHLPFYTFFVAITLISIAINRDIKKLPMNYAVMHVWIGWFIWMNVTTMFAIATDPTYTHNEWQRAITIQVISFLTVMVMQTKERIILLVWVIVVSVGYYAVKGGIFTILSGGSYLVFGPKKTFFAGNNSLAIATLMVIPLMQFLQMETDKKWLKIVLIGTMLLAGFTVIASYSRGAFLALGAVAFYLVLKSKRRLVILPVILLVGIMLLAFMPDKYTDRLNTIQTYEEDRSALGRINAWYFALNLAKDRPLVGGGFGAFTRELFYEYAPAPDDFHDAHSIYFESLGEHGFIGLLLFLLLGAATLKLINKTIKKTKNIEELSWANNISSMLYVGIIGYAVGGLFLGLAYFDLYYNLIGLAVLTRIVVDKKLAELKIKTDRHDDNVRRYES